MLDEALASFLQEGLAIHIGTRNDRFEPNGARVPAVTVGEDRQHLVVFIPDAVAGQVLPDLRSNGQAAVCFARPIDEQACQVKGVFVAERPGTAADEPEVMRQWHGFTQQLKAVGIPEVTASLWRMWPCVAVTIRVTELYNQTPGPGAGAPMDGASRR